MLLLQCNVKEEMRYETVEILSSHIARFTFLADDPRFVTFRRLKLSHITVKEAGQDACPARNTNGTLHAVDE